MSSETTNVPIRLLIVITVAFLLIAILFAIGAVPLFSILFEKWY